MKYLATAAFIAVTALGGTALAEGKTHYVAIHVNENDPARMNMALNNAQNVHNYYAAQGDEVVIEMVAYGPGLNMLVPGKSPVEQRVSSMSLEMPNLSFAACGNTHRKMSEKAGKEIALMSEATMVPSGVVRLIELQEGGYAYVRP
ncbi:DsrE family protein [Seohaeicola saemankumensis]|nr:DsrE family protein [Seohaeicola saemankumensis]MCA0873538.1 DsrE family protein [Seohaeicola saemankumensis]